MVATIGVLALQGGYEAHARVLHRLGAVVLEVRVPAHLQGLDGLIIPGGESTTMTIGVERERLAQPVRALARAGLPMFGSCAGMIMLDREHLGVMDIAVERNAFGRQINSFEADLELGPDRELDGLAEGPVRAVFIRAPWIVEHGPEVEVLARVDGHPVAARQGHVLAVAFHSELADDDRLHRLFLGWARAYARAGGASEAGGSGGLARSRASQP
ncbi:MAG: pyridoxal 5'-phosphate synthase glutaminase subunit PdxT [Actinobacteria bacterium]|nr:MAG: pyridoxal 5'-phosphate synthase glutaminase subunit PdxT [Actinomycetota bacterium]